MYDCLQGGVGEKIAKKIDEILATGKLNKLEKVHLNNTVEPAVILTQKLLILAVKCSQLSSSCTPTAE